MQLRSFVHGLMVSTLLVAAAQTAEAQKADERNSKPQKDYPEFSLEAQKAAMKRVEEMRRKARIEGLREKIPPADWIAVAYHGLVVDANFDDIEMNDKNVARIQESMFAILSSAAGEKMQQRHGDLKKPFHDQKLEPKERLGVRSAILDTLLSEADNKMRQRYGWRHRLVRRSTVLRPEIIEMLRELRIRYPFLIQQESQYVQDCRAQSVPIPPNWPDAGWISQGPLAFVFISRTLNAEVFAYKDPAVAGVCYALPRRDATGTIGLLGIICQSNTTGKACFWDNVMPNSTMRLQTVDINAVANGSNLGETCTECHRGYNVFNIHPGSALQLTRAGAPGGPYVTDPAVRYTPLAQATWSNPGPLSLPAPPAGQQSCNACHELPQTAGSSYCSSVLQNAARNTMPPFGPNRAGWPPTINPSYTDHITRLSTCP